MSGVQRICDGEAMPMDVFRELVRGWDRIALHLRGMRGYEGKCHLRC